MDHRRGRTGLLGATLAALLIGASCGSAGDPATPDSAPAASVAPSPPASEPNEETDVNDTSPKATPLQDQPTDTAADVPQAPAITEAPQTPPTPTESASTDAGTEASIDAPVPCRRITDFDGAESDGGWVIVNDGVMGGRSNGALAIDESIMRFSGRIVTAGGGFTSVRYRLVGGEMADTASLRLRVRADQRTYGITLEDNAEVGRRSVAHRADLDTTGPADSDGWLDVTLDYSEMTPSVFGQSVDASPFDPSSAREIGIIIADGTDGEFTLDVDWIDVCN